MTPAYAAALEVARITCRKFDEARIAYRAGKIGDVEFLAARAEWDVSQKAFDEAFTMEQGMEEVPAPPEVAPEQLSMVLA